MQTRTEHVESLLLDGVFDIPEYQRSYSWEERQLDELIDDLRYLPEDRTHFFGNIILDKKDEPYETASGRRLNVYQVVDGQQRLTSTLILLDVISELDQAVRESIQEGNVIHVPNDRPRLLPQNQDQEFFRDCILGDLSLSPDVPSQHRLKQAREFLYDRLNELQDEIEISTLATRLLYDFEINVVEVDDDSEAASIFESINDRGKPLSSLEKTKSFLMYMDDRANDEKSLQTQINGRFGGIYRELFVLEEGHSRVDDFDEDSLQQAHWGLYDGYDSDEYFNSLDTLKSRIYETYRSGEYDHVESIIDEYTSSLREASIAFADVFEPSSHSSNRVQERLNRLLELGRIANVLPILMAAQLEYGDDAPDRFADIIEKCETFVFRVYAVDRRRSDTGRGQLVRLAHSMYTDPDHEFEDTIRRLEEITRRYTDDDRFERELRDPDFYNTVSSRDIRYLLYQYGQQLEADAEEFVRRDLQQILSPEFQVEHILAQQLDEEYIPTESKEEYQEHVHRLGNLTIAGRYWNNTYGTLPFEEKKQLPAAESSREKAYETSSLKVQHVLASIEDFDLAAIDAREERIVEFALEEWALESPPADAVDMEEVLETAEELVVEGSAESTELDLSEMELFTLAAVLKTPGRALRSVHRTAASFDDPPIKWTDSWSDERTSVRSALWSLKEKGLVRLEQRSWYPEQETE